MVSNAKGTLTDATIGNAILAAVDAAKKNQELFMTPPKIVASVRRTLGAQTSKADILHVVDVLVERASLARFAGRSLYRPQKQRPTPRADERVRKHRNRCLFPLSKSTTMNDIREAIAARFHVVETKKSVLTFRWRTKLKRSGPTLRLAELDVAELRRLVKPKRAVESATGCAVLSFDDLDEVLDEANSLIEAQATIHDVTKRAFFNVWNGSRVD